MREYVYTSTHHSIKLAEGSIFWRLRHLLGFLEGHETLAQLDENMAVFATIVNHEGCSILCVVNPAIEVGVPRRLSVSEDSIGKVFPPE